MKKVRRSSSSRKSRSSSKRSFSGKSSSGTRKSRSSGGSFFSKKRRKTASSEKPRKPVKSGGLKDIFIKPPNDPGPKTQGETTEILEEYAEESDGGGVVQQALQNTGCGCCSSITGLIWFMAIGTLAVIILLILKCGGC